MLLCLPLVLCFCCCVILSHSRISSVYIYIVVCLFLVVVMSLVSFCPLYLHESVSSVIISSLRTFVFFIYFTGSWTWFCNFPTYLHLFSSTSTLDLFYSHPPSLGCCKKYEYYHKLVLGTWHVTMCNYIYHFLVQRVVVFL
ncbi:hypothetical protein BDP27DRAFT_1334848 [Rhodocollybia butyracea]|uniref:NADH dehydrogenase subunit 6 n=1 Tax=Rhodocollybia butyracea TaxID=206335 RepID=A0A9P5PDF7_9AGAR|nr:hypothetical protein BDP27DRAFT_1334848 [Rhodocollybia butyracea]